MSYRDFLADGGHEPMVMLREVVLERPAPLAREATP